MTHPPGAPSRRFQRADAPLKSIGAGKSCPLSVAGGEILLVSRVSCFAGAGVVPREFGSLFWSMFWGRQDHERSAPSWRVIVCSTIMGNENIRLWGKRNLLTGHIWIFPDYRLS